MKLKLRRNRDNTLSLPGRGKHDQPEANDLGRIDWESLLTSIGHARGISSF